MERGKEDMTPFNHSVPSGHWVTRAIIMNFWKSQNLGWHRNIGSSYVSRSVFDLNQEYTGTEPKRTRTSTRSRTHTRRASTRTIQPDEERKKLKSVQGFTTQTNKKVQEETHCVMNACELSNLLNLKVLATLWKYKVAFETLANLKWL